MDKVPARAWQTLIQVIRESSQETYSKKDLLSLMARILKEEASNVLVERLEQMIEEAVRA